ncbi:oxidoreductase [Streptomyces violarus]|uniref:NADP-dependent 3-hydroxy acid dehydrogenase YdfG n=1 Tax=Streptomyces violarus TaxID=67380 RepID=A0A7W5F1V9_9ACTN|nr:MULTISPECIES: SDR family oxidoreductase [Streptomyces]MBB3076951.1 NADP-dependent 3-hydroxy acid dehydrogenase YdfG [Streptomyces violarus]WRU01391.1 SDR family oxidoreductase [Streptomyces sp. CGMCC 4.1772]GHD22840.1 oxidoreductase [Streptomyces violarus]
MNHLQDKVVVITGASSGIGAISAKALAARGAKIVAAARSQEDLDQLVADIEKAGGTAAARLTDVSDAADMQALADFTVAAYGRIDVLVNNAGLMLFSYWKDLALHDWNRMLDVNIRGYLNGVHAVLPVMLRQKSGHILNMDSVAGHQVGDGAGVYSATKFFVQAMTESMRKELGVREGIKASTISPGVIDTGWADKVTDPAGRKAAQELNTIAISPEAIADAVVYALDQPADVTVNDLVISPTRQNW